MCPVCLLKIPVAFTCYYQMNSYHKPSSTHLSLGLNKTLFCKWNHVPIQIRLNIFELMHA